ncbi:MAG: type II toxin-antitoxin system YafQ family toxin [Actinobacteria bacterium]|nr:type II toxin-antitoxin system YafQ family toxin [Actinomycetota bacterium]
MNKNVHYTTQFRKDFKLCIKRGYNMKQLKSIMKLLESGKELPEKNKDHSLTGNYLDCRECHVQFDWLLIYQLLDSGIIFIRTGSHSDLFS